VRGLAFISFFVAATFSYSLAQLPPTATPGALHPAQPSVLPAQSFDGTESQTTTSFTIGDKWEVRFHSAWGTCHLRPLTNMAQAAPPANQNQNATPFQDTVNRGFNGGNQQNPNSSPNNGNQGQNGGVAGENPQLHAQQTYKHWWVEVVEMSSPAAATPDGQMLAIPNYALPGTSGDAPATSLTSATAPGATQYATATSPSAPVAPASKMSEDQARAVVLIKGDNAEGTGFMIKTPNGPAVITNIHVIANNPNLKITTNTGALVTVLSEKGACDRDLAMLSIQDDGYNYLQFSPDISKNVQPGDEVITPGNSQGGEVMLNTGGKVLGIGPVRIEFDNPIYHGNSGGPVFHPKSGKVLGVVTEAMKVNTSDDLDKASFASRNSAISGSMRYFGLRLDTVAAWIPIDSRRFQIETTFLDEFHEQSRRLDAYLNHGENDRDEAAKLYHSDAKIMKANDNYAGHSTGSDTAQHIDLIRSLVFDLQCVADIDMDQIRDKNNFYKFDQDRAQDEYDYRTALKKELDSIGNNVERASFLPRSNN